MSYVGAALVTGLPMLGLCCLTSVKQSYKRSLCLPAHRTPGLELRLRRVDQVEDKISILYSLQACNGCNGCNDQVEDKISILFSLQAAIRM